MVQIEIKHRNSHLAKIDKTSELEDLMKTFCKQNRIRLSSARFVFEGERVHVNDTPASLGIRDGDVIEAFTMVTGGGKPEKENISGDSSKILDALDCLSVSEDSDDFTSSDENDEETIISSQDQVISFEEEPTETLVETRSDLIIKFVGNVGFNSSIEDLEKLDERMEAGIKSSSKEHNSFCEVQMNVEQSETCIKRSTFLSSLRKDYKDGKLNDKNPLDRKIIHFLKQSELAPVELQILLNLSEQRSFHEEWQLEKDKLYPEYAARKEDSYVGSIKDKTSESSTKLTLYYGENDKQTENKEESTQEEQLNDSQFEEPETNSCKETPQKRKELFEKFGIKTPSPLIKLSKVTEEEMKQLSIAIHLWAENKYGSVKSLEQVRLKENNFKEVLDFAGPGTRYNLLKGRSVLQYKSLWRNSAQSKHSFRGHPQSGFENEEGHHDPSSQFCPFEHCKTGIFGPINPLEMDMMFATPERIRKVRSFASSSRKLFENRTENMGPIEASEESHIEPNMTMLEEQKCKCNQVQQRKSLRYKRENFYKRFNMFQTN